MRTVLTILAETILAALTVLTGCGGWGFGGGGFMPVPAAIVNTAGVDIRDTWKSTEPRVSYFGLEKGGSLPRFEGLDASGYPVLASKNGITYAQRTSGPTDTIDIDFTGYFDQLPDYVKGGIERAGKAWSHRLKDVLGPFMSTDSVVTRKGRDENGWTIPRLVDGMLLDIDSDFENPEWDYVWGYSTGGFRYEQVVGQDFTVRTGWVPLAAKDINRGTHWMAYIAAHQIGHAIGHVASFNTLPEAIPRFVDFDRGVWTDPATTTANGGRNVPFQKNRDGEPDFGHLGACPMIMSYCSDDSVIPHEMDFAYMKDIGYFVADKYPARARTLQLWRVGEALRLGGHGGPAHDLHRRPHHRSYRGGSGRFRQPDNRGFRRRAYGHADVERLPAGE